MSAGPLFGGPSLDFNNMALPRQVNLGDDVKQDLRQAKREIELLKTMDPFRAAEMSLEIQMEKMRVAETIAARDNVVKRLVDAHVSIRQKVAVIDHLESEKAELRRKLSELKGLCDEDVECSRNNSESEVVRLQHVIDGLRNEVRSLKEFRSEPRKPSGDPPPSYDAGIAKMNPSFLKDISRASSERSEPSRVPFRVLRENSATSSENFQSNAGSMATSNSLILPGPLVQTRNRTSSNDPEYMMTIRHALLAALPIPIDIPTDDALSPVNIPPPFTLHEFLGTTTGPLKNSLSNYRIFHELTTSWCPQREEHGYMLTPVYKCSTNPRAATAHRWSEVDNIAKMNKPTECFYNKDGKWYYAGIYKAFRLENLSMKEWEELSDETSQLLIKDTLAARKNTSPQNHYEVSQLYAAGALKVACVGLQCVGFNNALYRTICASSVSASESVGSVGSAASSGSTYLSASGSLSGGLEREKADVGGSNDVDENVRTG